MEIVFQPHQLGSLALANRFVFPPIKTGFGIPGGVVTERLLTYYQQIAKSGPGIQDPIRAFGFSNYWIWIFLGIRP